MLLFLMVLYSSAYEIEDTTAHKSQIKYIAKIKNMTLYQCRRRPLKICTTVKFSILGNFLKYFVVYMNCKLSEFLKKSVVLNFPCIICIAFLVKIA